ncbi:TetR/AcrR family transcriptional regulator [Nocardiopsis dassonvillei subsp. albirubida]|uniref:TetR/AcrR family transcriptional regulator n=1 Tax=Nocardiopsis alborubida TaxID=146802 RepID=A0A7X6MIP6_9ACTN|nr:TetR/AcrR family transcriptional regulator [Nocardiopsis alborubida]
MTKSAGDPGDPRVARTRRDVIQASAAILLEDGWGAATHAAVARRSGYSKATLYAHWPTPTDLMRDAIDRICEESTTPAPSGDLREDLRTLLGRFALALSERRYDQLMAGAIELAGRNEVARELRDRLYETATKGIRDTLATHLPARDVDPSLAMLVGAVLVRVTYEGEAATAEFIADVVDRVLG